MEKNLFYNTPCIVNYGSFLQTYATQKLFETTDIMRKFWIMFEKMKSIIM